MQNPIFQPPPPLPHHPPQPSTTPPSTSNSLILPIFFILFFFSMPQPLYWCLVSLYWLYFFKSKPYEYNCNNNNSPILFPHLHHTIKHHSLSGKLFQKVTKFAIKWTFDIREELSHFRAHMTLSKRLKESIERTLNAAYLKESQYFWPIWENFNFTQEPLNFKHIGQLTVTVHKADLSDYKFSKISTFAKLELVNKKQYTKIEPKTLTPNWNQAFTFKIKDIVTKLELSLLHQTAFETSKLIGSIAIPLHQIQTGQRQWFILSNRANSAIKGKIFLEFTISYNPIKAALKTIFSSKEVKEVEAEEKIRFNRAHFFRNVLRVKAILRECLEWARFAKSCLEWDCHIRSITGLVFTLVTIYYFEWYMIPLTLLILMLKNLILINLRDKLEDDAEIEERVKKGDSTVKKGELEQFNIKLDQFTNFMINTLLENSSFIDRIENLFNFTVPFLSWVFLGALTAATLLWYLVSLRLVIMAFIINEFTKEFRKFHTCSNILCNNEFYNFFSRVPDLDEMDT